jgi:hypothetical protein
MSALRSSWNVNDARQPSKPATTNGTFTATAVPSATRATRTAPFQSGAARPPYSAPPRPPVST